MAEVQIDHRLLVLDTADLNGESSFWADVLEGTVDDLGESHMVVVDGIPQVGLQLVRDHLPPAWAEGSAHRVRIDMWVGDPVGSHAFVVDRGATVLDDPELDEPGNGFRIYASPAGHPFALCWRQQ